MGPVFAKRWLDSAVKFCNLLKIESLIIEEKNYVTVWILNRKKAVQQIAPEAQAAPIDSDFIQSCQDALVLLIGPMGKVIIQQAQQAKGVSTPRSFIQAIIRRIPDPIQAEAFSNQFLAMPRQHR